MGTVTFTRPRQRLTEIIGAPGGLTIERGAESAQDRIDAARQQVLDALAAKLKEIAAIAADPARRDAAYRRANETVGLAGLVALPFLAEAARSLCDVLDADPAEGAAARAVLDAHVAALPPLLEPVPDEVGGTVLGGLRSLAGLRPPSDAFAVVECVFASLATTPPAEFAETARGIALAAERRNPGRGLTGLLLARDGWYLHAVEGPHEAVAALAAALLLDPRHRRVRFLSVQGIAQPRHAAPMTLAGSLGPRATALVAALSARFDPATIDGATARGLLDMILLKGGT